MRAHYMSFRKGVVIGEYTLSSILALPFERRGVEVAPCDDDLLLARGAEESLLQVDEIDDLALLEGSWLLDSTGQHTILQNNNLGYRSPLTSQSNPRRQSTAEPCR